MDELGDLSGFERGEGKVWSSSEWKLERPPNMSDAELINLKDVEVHHGILVKKMLEVFASAFLVEHDYCHIHFQ